jgi:hypothetical protein
MLTLTQFTKRRIENVAMFIYKQTELTVVLTLLAALSGTFVAAPQTTTQLDRTVLPIRNR